MSRRTASTIALASLAAVACGARTDLDDDRAARDASVSPADAHVACLPATVRGVEGWADEGRCTLEGRSSDGHLQRMECRFAPPGCVWITDGVERCSCDNPDWVNTCPNGVPICVGWNLPFDFASDVRFDSVGP